MKYELVDRMKNAPQPSAGVIEAAGGNAVLARILCSRGIDSREAAQAFLNPDVSQLLDPMGLRDMKKAVQLIRSAVENGRRIIIHGDYDADGTSGAAILAKTLRRMGVDVPDVAGGTARVIIPSRDGAGYGLNADTIACIPDGALLITVDCGIRSVVETELAHSRGIDVIITDHHTCPANLPEADCILNPRAPGETYDNPHLCGAGVAFKLAHALLGLDQAMEFIDIAALATIADVVPLTGENRTIAALGLAKMNENPSAGIAALKAIRRNPDAPVTSSVVAFDMVPVINAAGRVQNARMAYDLLSAEKPANGMPGKAEIIAPTLAVRNQDRRDMQKAVMHAAEEKIHRLPSLPRFIILADKAWQVGIVGPVASRIAEKYRRPTVLLCWNGEAYVGSGRTADGVDLYDALSSAEHLMDKFGGHTQAAGLTIREENLESLKSEMEQYMARHEEAHGASYRSARIAEYDLEPRVPVDDLTMDAIAKMEPCGCENPIPVALFRNAQIVDKRTIGQDGTHLAFRIRRGENSMRAVMFDTSASDTPSTGDIVGELQRSTFGASLGQVETIVRVLSAETDDAKKLRLAAQKLRNPGPPSNKEDFYRDRQRMGLIYSAFRDAAPGGSIVALDELYRMSKARIPNLEHSETAFAYTVFEELGLIEDVADGKIKVVIKDKNAPKTKLSDSRIYEKCER